MKKMRFISLCVCALTLAACGGDTTKNDAQENQATTVSEKKTDDLKGMHSVNLTEYDIDASLFIPDNSKGKQEFNLTDAGSLEIIVGEKYGIAVTPFGLTVEEKKEELANDLVYSIEYLKEEPNCIIYKRSITDSEMKPEFHFFMNANLGEDTYEIKSMDNRYSEKAIEKMIKSAKSLIANS